MAVRIVLTRSHHFGVVSRFTNFELNSTTTSIRAWTQETLIVFTRILAAVVGLRTCTGKKSVTFPVAGNNFRASLTFPIHSVRCLRM
jgi:hypothetical protein